MAEQTGIVVHAEPEGLARVVMNRRNACGGCHSNRGGGCRSCLAQAKMEIQVANSIGARTGDMVRFSMRSSDFFKAAAMIYLLPILAVLTGALVGAWMGTILGWQETSGAMAGVAVGLSMSAVFLILLDRSRWARQRLAPKMTAVVFSGPSSRPRPSGVRHACCEE